MIEPTLKQSIDMQTHDALNSNNFGNQGYTVTVKFLYKAGAPTPPNALFRTDEYTHNLFWRPRLSAEQGTFSGGWDRLLIKDEVTPNPDDYKAFVPFKPNSRVNDWLTPALLPIPV